MKKRLGQLQDDTSKFEGNFVEMTELPLAHILVYTENRMKQKFCT